MAAVFSVRREHLVAALLVGGVVVIVGFASGLGLRTTTTNAQAADTPATASPNPGTAVPDGQLPQASVPQMTMPGNQLPADIPVPSDYPTTGDDSGTVPVVQVPPTDPGSTTPVSPTEPGTPTQPTTPTNPEQPSTCLPGVAQQVADTANTVVGALPVVSTLTGTLGLTQSPDGTNPGALNTLLYSVTGYCATTTTDPANPLSTLTSALPALAPAKVGG